MDFPVVRMGVLMGQKSKIIQTFSARNIMKLHLRKVSDDLELDAMTRIRSISEKDNLLCNSLASLNVWLLYLIFYPPSSE